MVPIEIAAHEIGHAIAALNEPETVLVSVAVGLEGAHSGLVRVRRRRDADPRATAVTCLAGYAAETRWLHGPNWQPDAGAFEANGHLRDVSDAVAAIAGFTNPAAEMQNAWDAARAIVNAEWLSITRLAFLLRRCGCMGGAEIEMRWRACRALL